MKTTWNLAAAALACAAATAQETVPPNLGVLVQRWEEAAETLRVPGLAVLILRDSEVVLRKTMGIRDRTGRPVTDRSAFYIASCTKPFIATGILMLAEEGHLTIDDPVVEHLPRFRLADSDATESTTIRDLLSHAKGIDCGPIVFLDAYSGEITEDRYYGLLRDVVPSGRTAYTNVHFTLAGRVLEALTGQDWREVLRERIFARLEMSDATGFADSMYARDDVAIPLEGSPRGGFQNTIRKCDDTMHAAGGLGMSLRDLERWLQFLLGRGAISGGPRLLEEATFLEMERLQAKLDEPRGGSPFPRVDGFTLGWFHGEFRGRRILRHGGGYLGAAAQISFLPEEGLAFACVANTSGGGQGLVQLIEVEALDALLGHESPDLLPRLVQQVQQFEERTAGAAPSGVNPIQGGLTLEAPAYLGDYFHAAWGLVQVRRAEAGLVLRLGALRGRLHSTGPDTFVADMGTGVPSAGRFVVEGGPCVAVTLDLAGIQGVRFDRQS